MKLNRKQLRRMILKEMSDPRLGIAMEKGHGEGPATDAVASLINDCFLKGGATGSDNAVGYAIVTLEQAGYKVGKAGEVIEQDADVIYSIDEANGTGMLYYPDHPKYQYSM